MVQNIFKGLGIALITPFCEDGSVDYGSISVRQRCRFLLYTGNNR